MSTTKKRPANKRYDALVVMAGSINERGEIPEFVRSRVKEAVAVSRNETPIIMSGLWSYLISYVPPRSGASAMKTYALSLSSTLDPDKIKLEEASLDTVGSAYYSKMSFLEPRNWRNILLITSDYHITRSMYIYRKILGGDYTITPLPTPSGFTAKELKAKAAHEEKLLALTKHFLEPIQDGDSQAVRRIMDAFPGYSPNPKYSRTDLIEILDIGIPVVDTYGVNQLKP